MKRMARAITLGIVLGLAPAALAQATCGIGSQLWEGNSSAGAKVMASITNFWTGKAISTTFNIAGCTEADSWFTQASDAQVYGFANQNFDHLALEMARGRGEYLDALAGLIGIDDSDRGAFRTLTRTHFAELYPDDRITAPEMLQTLSSLMAGSEALSRYAST